LPNTLAHTVMLLRCDYWWHTKWQWDLFHPEYFGFPC